MSRRRLAGLAVAAVLVLLFGGRWVALRYTEHAWYASLGLERAFWTLLARSAALQALTLAAAFGWYAATTLAVYRSIGAVHLPRRLGNLEIAEAVPRAMLRGIALGVAGVLALATTYTFSDLHHLVALYRHAVPFGTTEPVLGRDAAFYLARLPLLESLHLLATLAVLLATALAMGLYALTGSLTLARRRLQLTPHARTHLTLLLVALAITAAWGFWLDAVQTVGGGGANSGALSPVDRAIRIPAANALALIALGVAIGTAFALRWTRAVALFGYWATLGMATLLGRLVIPLLADAWGAGASPSVSEALASYADNYGRTGFGLLILQHRSAGDSLGVAPDPGALGAALSGFSPWSGEPALLAGAMAAATGDTTRWRAWSVAMARYRDRAGQPRLVALAASQLDPLVAARERPPADWTHLHRGSLAWGGEPLAALADRGGTPLRFVAGLEPVDTAPGPLPLARAGGRIRFLAGAADLAVVSPDEATIDEPAPGIRLGGFARRLLLAWALQTPPLLSRRTSSADRLLIWRDLPSRLARLFPFAAFDPARPAMVGDRLVWVADGYLASARFPLAERIRWNGDDINYLAAPYLVVVDAVSGDTRLYQRPPADRFAAALARASGLVPLPPDSIPAALARQLGYPRGLLVAQAAALARRGDGPGGERWAVAAADSVGAEGPDAATLVPGVALLALDGPERELWQLLALTDAGGTRLAAVVAGTAAEGGEPKLLLVRAAGTHPTPVAAAGRFNASPAVLAAAAALAGVEGAVRRGPVQVLPVPGGFAYAQTLFATPDRARERPSARLVTLLAGDGIGVGADAREAAGALRRGEDGPAGSLAASAALAEARAAFLAFDSAMRQGDWTAAGRAWETLRRALRAGTPEWRP